MSDNVRRVRAVEQFVGKIMAAAIFDAQDGIAKYDSPRNSGQRLLERLNLRSCRICPRNGDAKYARSIYTATRWLYETETHD